MFLQCGLKPFRELSLSNMYFNFAKYGTYVHTLYTNVGHLITNVLVLILCKYDIKHHDT